MGAKMRKLLLIGGGGHCKSVIDVLNENNYYDEIGILDYKNNLGKFIQGIKVVGTDEDLPILKSEGFSEAFITLGSIGNSKRRVELYNILKTLGYTLPKVKSRSSVISDSAYLEEGIFIGKNAVINVECKIGLCSIINTGSIIEHDCTIGKFCHVSPGAVICGQANIKDYSHIGANATIIQDIIVGQDVLIGAGSVIISNIEDGKKVVGVPGKVIGDVC